MCHALPGVQHNLQQLSQITPAMLASQPGTSMSGCDTADQSSDAQPQESAYWVEQDSYGGEAVSCSSSNGRYTTFSRHQQSLHDGHPIRASRSKLSSSKMVCSAQHQMQSGCNMLQSIRGLCVLSHRGSRHLLGRQACSQQLILHRQPRNSHSRQSLHVHHVTMRQLPCTMT